MAKLPSNIRTVDFGSNEWFKEESQKTQIYLHHTAGRGDGERVFKFWDTDRRGRISTCIAISNANDGGKDGEIVQGFSSKYWGYHLGLSNGDFRRNGLNYIDLNKISIGVEICSWGALEYRDGKYYSWAKVEVPADQVDHLETPFRNIVHFQKYTQKQIESVCALLLYWKDRYGIDITYKPENFWNISKDALQGKNGLYSHAAVRYDKSDVYPSAELISALKKIS
jgi:N-acetyl-anhydromuramyl-L-alanine amidase AmpD